MTAAPLPKRAAAAFPSVRPASAGRAAALLALSLGLGACAVGPDYKAPPAASAASPQASAFAGASVWRVGVPRDALPRGAWWTLFGDPVLDGLESRAAASSPDLQAALARADAALALAYGSRAALLPSLAANPSVSRERYSGNRQVEYPATTFAYTSTSFDAPLDLTVPIDLFGQARRALESARDSAQAREAAYQSVLLGLQTGVARTYFQLRALATQRELLAGQVDLLTQALALVQALRSGGAGSELDLVQARAELETVQARAAALEAVDARTSHALAVLTGVLPNELTLEPAPLREAPPAVPALLPSELLERRPDVAAAERNLAAANARIGVAKAAFYPSIGLAAFGGLNASQSGLILRGDSREWGLGPVVSIPLFRGGSIRAAYTAAQADYREALAQYRSQVLGAFQQVEDDLSDLDCLGRQEAALRAAAADAFRASDLSLARYKDGLVPYLEVLTAQRTELQARLDLSSVQSDRIGATLALIGATGGGW